MLDFNISSKLQKDLSVLRISGEIDIHTAPKLKKFFKQLLEKGQHKIILNLNKVRYIDSTGLGTIVYLSQEIAKFKGLVRLVSQNPHLKKIFGVAGLDDKNLPFFEEEAAALNAVGQEEACL
jgi:anti-sigma B factor antagonist